VYGAVVGAFVFVALQEIYSSMTTHWQLLLGTTIIVLVIFLPVASPALPVFQGRAGRRSRR
jgi:branched-chain amino acid transport system permease protein